MARPKIKRIQRKCKHPNCSNTFECKVKDTKMYCSKKCSNTSPYEIAIRNEHAKHTVDTKYSGIHYTNLPEVKEKHYNSMLKNHGVEHALQIPGMALRVQKTINEKYDRYELALKGMKTRMKKYGRNSPIPIKHRKKIWKRILSWTHITPLFEINELLEHGVYTDYKYNFKCNKCGIILKKGLANGNIPRCKPCAMRNLRKSSKSETEVLNFIKENLPKNTIIQQRVRNILPNNYEIDIYIPDYKIAVEYNGIYWHSEHISSKPKNYHLSKTKQCAQKGIELLHILDYYWHTKNDITKSLLLRKFNLTESININDLTICEIKSASKNEWLYNNHIEGYCYTNYNIALKDKNKNIVSLMCFRKRKNKNGNYYELVRCGDANYIYIKDGFKVLLEYFIKKYAPNKIITYIDRSLDTGNLLLNNNFYLSGIIQPDFYYTHGNYFNLFPKEIKKENLPVKKLKKFDKNLTKWQNMKKNGFDRYWNCGYFVYQLNCK